LAERLALVGGHLTAGPLADGGYRVEGRLPVPAPATKVPTADGTNDGGAAAGSRAH
jgi:hypothetical protein